MEQIKPNQTLSEILNPKGEKYLKSMRKRLLDIAGASLSLTASLPLLTVAAIAVKMEDHGPAFFAQERVGLDGEVFSIHKLRTMHPNAHEQGTPLIKPREDPRITKVGKILRRTSIDEIPQYWDILRGKMSLVGPRPVGIEEHMNKAEIAGMNFDDYMNQITIAKPGITCITAINGRGELKQNQEGIEESVGHDLAYIRNASIGMDLTILFKTVGTVISGRGAF